MKKTIIISLSVATLWLFGSCGGDSTRKTDANPDLIEEKAEKLSPLQIGENVADLYVKAITQLSELVKDHPPAQEVMPKIEALKEEYIQQLVTLGKQREELDSSDKSIVDSNIRTGIRKVYDQDAYTIYGEAVNHYFQEKEVHALLTDFNIITQYANFDLLKEQEPEEAQRLGIN